MKKFLLVLSAVIMTVLFTGCSVKQYTCDVTHDNNDRFRVVYSQSVYPAIGDIEIIMDKETNTKYMIVERAEGIGVTKLEE